MTTPRVAPHKKLGWDQSRSAWPDAPAQMVAWYVDLQGWWGRKWSCFIANHLAQITSDRKLPFFSLFPVGKITIH